MFMVCGFVLCPIKIVPVCTAPPIVTLPVVWLVPMSMFCVVPENATLPPAPRFPVAPTHHVTLAPRVLNTAMFAVPPIPTVTLPPELTTVTFDVPLLMLATEVMTPLKNAPLPKI